MTFLPPISGRPRFCASPMSSCTFSSLGGFTHERAPRPIASSPTAKTVEVFRDLLPSLIPDQPLASGFTPSPMRMFSPSRMAHRSPNAELLPRDSLQQVEPVSMRLLSSHGQKPSLDCALRAQSGHMPAVAMGSPHSAIGSPDSRQIPTPPSPSFDLQPVRTLSRCPAPKVFPQLMKCPREVTLPSLFRVPSSPPSAVAMGSPHSAIGSPDSRQIPTPPSPSFDLQPVRTLSRCPASKVFPQLMKCPRGAPFEGEHDHALIIESLEGDLAGMSLSKLTPSRGESGSVASPVAPVQVRSLEESSPPPIFSERHKNAPSQDYLALEYPDQVHRFMVSCAEFKCHRRHIPGNLTPSDILFYHQARTKQFRKDVL